MKEMVINVQVLIRNQKELYETTNLVTTRQGIGDTQNIGEKS